MSGEAPLENRICFPALVLKIIRSPNNSFPFSFTISVISYFQTRLTTWLKKSERGKKKKTWKDNILMYIFISSVLPPPPPRAVVSPTVPGGQEFHFPHFSSNLDQLFLKLYLFFPHFGSLVSPPLSLGIRHYDMYEVSWSLFFNRVKTIIWAYSVTKKKTNKQTNKTDWLLLFLKAFSWKTDLWVTLGDFMVNNAKGKCVFNWKSDKSNQCATLTGGTNMPLVSEVISSS